VLVRALCALLLTVISVLGLANAATASTTAPAATSASASTTSTDGTHHPAPTPCLRDAGCGGGAFALGGAGLVVGVLPAAVGLVAGPRARTRLAHLLHRLGDRLTASRLYRPPRLSF
jgi:hypothetical protein